MSKFMNSIIIYMCVSAILLVICNCSSEIKYNRQITNFDYRQLDGILIYNRDFDTMIFELFRIKSSGLVFIDNNLKIKKKPNNYRLKDEQIIAKIKVYKRMHLSYCRIDYGNMIRVISNGIDYVKISKQYDDKIFLFNKHKQEYTYIGNDWYVKY